MRSFLNGSGAASMFGACGIMLLGGCQVQNTTVVDQSAAMGSVPNHVTSPVVRVLRTSPCAAPAGTGPFEHLSKPETGLRLHMPARAVDEHVNGCAGVRFRIGPGGAPSDVAVLTEYPLGYGFGEAGRKAVSSARWAPKDDMAWRYLIINMWPDGRPHG